LKRLYEAVRWGNDSEDRFEGGPDGPDTCFLVRAGSIEEVVSLVEPLLMAMPHVRIQPWLHAIHLLGDDTGVDPTSRVLRGPYVQHAIAWGWRSGIRVQDEEWTELPPEDARPGN
jgi:hypothetical protein